MCKDFNLAHTKFKPSVKQKKGTLFATKLALIEADLSHY